MQWFISPNTAAKFKDAPLRVSGCAFHAGQPALKVRLAASSKRDGNEWAWVMNVAPTAAAVWDELKCEVAGNAAQNAEWCSCRWRAR